MLLRARTSIVSSLWGRSFSTKYNPDVLGVELGMNNSLAIVLNRPSALNALNLSMVKNLSKLLQDGEKNDEVQFYLVTGAEDKAFCAGGDIKALYDSGKGNGADAYQFFREEYKLNHLISQLKKPYVSLIQGITMGGGIGVSVHGKYRVAFPTTRVAMPEAAIGFFCDVGGSYFLPRLPHNIGYYLALTGESLHGYDAYDAGLATHFAEGDKSDFLAQTIKLEINELVAHLDAITPARGSASSRVPWELASKHFGKGTLFEIIESLQRDTSPAAQKALEKIRSHSPISLNVIFEQLQRGSKLDLAQCLQMEYALGHKFLKGKDFYTGVSSVLKIEPFTRPPVWSSTLEEISFSQVQDYFAFDPSVETISFN